MTGSRGQISYQTYAQQPRPARPRTGHLAIRASNGGVKQSNPIKPQISNTNITTKNPTVGRNAEAIKSADGRQSTASAWNKIQAVQDYVIGDTIGEGTFGKVKRGVHKLTNISVAIKVLEKERIVDIADVERVKREIHILTRVQHPNVIRLYEVIDSPRHIFLISNFLPGGELFDYIVAQGRVKEPEACRFFHDILNGVDYCHRRSIIHRDLKPENLLLDNDKGITLVDFGLGNTVTDGNLMKTACGSPCYAAPEMIAGKKYKGDVADMWSLGVILFALVCGYLPFEDANTVKLYKKIMSGDYKVPSFVSSEVGDLIAKLLNVNPVSRYTPAQVRAHVWYIKQSTKSDPQYRPFHLDKPGVETLNEDVIRHMVLLGYDSNQVVESVKNNRHDHCAATYHFLVLRRKHLLETKPSQEASSKSTSKPSTGTTSSKSVSERSTTSNDIAVPVPVPVASVASVDNGYLNPVDELLHYASNRPNTSNGYSTSGKGVSPQQIIATNKKTSDPYTSIYQAAKPKRAATTTTTESSSATTTASSTNASSFNDVSTSWAAQHFGFANSPPITTSPIPSSPPQRPATASAINTPSSYSGSGSPFPSKAVNINQRANKPAIARPQSTTGRTGRNQQAVRATMSSHLYANYAQPPITSTAISGISGPRQNHNRRGRSATGTRKSKVGVNNVGYVLSQSVLSGRKPPSNSDSLGVHGYAHTYGFNGLSMTGSNPYQQSYTRSATGALNPTSAPLSYSTISSSKRPQTHGYGVHNRGIVVQSRVGGGSVAPGPQSTFSSTGANKFMASHRAPVKTVVVPKTTVHSKSGVDSNGRPNTAGAPSALSSSLPPPMP